MNSKMTFAATSLLLAGALAISTGCASTSEDGDNGGSSGSSSGSSAGGSGGSSSSGGGGAAPSGDGFSFKSGQADGLFTGYGWVALGAKDSLSSPECDTGKPITNAEACTTSTVWKDGGDGKLCMTGSIPALPASPVQKDYDDNWGVQIGVNAAEPPDQAGDKMNDYTTVTFTFSGNPKSGLRGMIHRKGDSDATTYCVDSIKSGTAITLTKFNTKCWGDTTTVLLTKDDLPKIDKVGVQVSSTSAEIKVEDFCLEKVEFGK